VERLAIFAALQWECRAVLGRLPQVRRGRIDAFTCWRAQANGFDVLIVKTGVGVTRAAAAIGALGDLAPFSLIVSAGCAGGLDGALRPGDLVLATALSGDGTRDALPTDAVRRADARQMASAAGIRTVEGPIVCSAMVLATVAEKRAAAAGGAVAVEMEGGPIAAAAAAAGIPFLSVRTVLDCAEHAVPVPPGLMDPASGAVRPLATAVYLATHPRAIIELRALQRLQIAARDSLERFFTTWLGPARPTASQEIR